MTSDNTLVAFLVDWAGGVVMYCMLLVGRPVPPRFVGCRRRACVVEDAADRVFRAKRAINVVWARLYGSGTFRFTVEQFLPTLCASVSPVRALSPPRNLLLSRAIYWATVMIAIYLHRSMSMEMACRLKWTTGQWKRTTGRWNELPPKEMNCQRKW